MQARAGDVPASVEERESESEKECTEGNGQKTIARARGSEGVRE